MVLLKKDEVVIEKITKSLYGKTSYQVKYYSDASHIRLVDVETLKESVRVAKKIKADYNKKRIRRTF